MNSLCRLWMALLVSTLLLAACAPSLTPNPTAAPSNPTAAPTAAPVKPATQPTAAPTSVPAAKPTTAPAAKPAASPAAAAIAVASPAAAFPVTIEHKFGRTTIPAEPRRVVTVGYSDHDTALALGIKPVGVREWYGKQPYATWPWAQDELGDATPAVLPTGELDFEQIAALRPDLILGVYSGLTQDEYARLSAIAPTVAQSGQYANYATPWQEMARVIGRALGRPERAEQRIADIQERFVRARSAYPEFGRMSGVAAYSFRPGEFGVYGPGDPRTEFLAALGFKLPADVAALVPADSFFTTVSAEQLRLLDRDVLVWFTLTPSEPPAIEALPLYQGLRVAREGRDVFLGGDSPLSGALSFSSVLSLPYAIDGLVPQLAAAADGDPATRVGP